MKKYVTMALYKGAVVIDGVVSACSEAAAIEICKQGLKENNESVEASMYGCIVPVEQCKFLAYEI